MPKVIPYQLIEKEENITTIKTLISTEYEYRITTIIFSTA